MADKQRTISKTISLSGKGLHSGVNVTVTLKPAPVNTGFVFKRVDLKDQPEIKALAENVIHTNRNTTISSNGAEISTIEHTLAALTGLGIDNVYIEVDGPEIPIMDGSSKYFVELIKKSGIKSQESDREYFIPKEKIRFADEEKNISIEIFPDDKFSLEVHIDYNSKVLGYQYASLDRLEDFENEISNCRTFVFLHELEPLLKNNLIKGGDLDNAIVIVEHKVSQEEINHLADLFNKPKVEVMPEGILNNVDLAFSNEPARHKLLDVLGDLSLIGMPIRGKVIAKRPGHFSNTELAKQIRKQIKLDQKKPKPPEYNPNHPPVFDLVAIKKMLPHRPPFLLVDKITYMDDWTICGIKNVTMNESYFVGHYPEEPIMPGVLQIEAMAQVGGLLLLSQISNPSEYLLYFLKIENVKFKHKVVPGDTLNIRMNLLEPVKRGIALTYGQVFVGNTLVLEGNFMAQLAKKEPTKKV
ncbi:MAG: bifunctional UDP-3-O-[3-hydroxymyristoyl] N-acetylglucosamine deacetylase/3-hydroxyacyl-ACP dehydratase [Bacteroidales bacterium]|nr:bifunctional UDP-3-O-[3-hydroxymyristoyl] N-acetylglucosamine deacetylase/3-hydroxyacyl-ACP dehydratase [Bacteroidales bacterium]